MSRSTYIWVVTRMERSPVAAFTVKHELAAWLERSPGDRSELRITRLRDGRTSSEPVVLDPITLEPALDPLAPADLVHGGGNAEDCPICRHRNLPYPFICTAHGEAHAAFGEHFKDAATWTEEGT